MNKNECQGYFCCPPPNRKHTCSLSGPFEEIDSASQHLGGRGWGGGFNAWRSHHRFERYLIFQMIWAWSRSIRQQRKGAGGETLNHQGAHMRHFVLEMTRGARVHAHVWVTDRFDLRFSKLVSRMSYIYVETELKRKAWFQTLTSSWYRQRSESCVKIWNRINSFCFVLVKCVCAADWWEKRKLPFHQHLVFREDLHSVYQRQKLWQQLNIKFEETSTINSRD